MAKFQRPANDFWISDLKSDLDIVRRHTDAGFDPIAKEVIQLRLFILYDFLWGKGLLVEQLAEQIEDIKPDTALWNRHLTPDGYDFLQKYLPRWQSRSYKHTTEVKERGFLDKWYQQFVASKNA